MTSCNSDNSVLSFTQKRGGVVMSVKAWRITGQSLRILAILAVLYIIVIFIFGLAGHYLTYFKASGLVFGLLLLSHESFRAAAKKEARLKDNA